MYSTKAVTTTAAPCFWSFVCSCAVSHDSRPVTLLCSQQLERCDGGARQNPDAENQNPVALLFSALYISFPQKPFWKLCFRVIVIENIYIHFKWLSWKMSAFSPKVTIDSFSVRSLGLYWTDQ